LHSWVSRLKEVLAPLDEETALVCHSLGCAAAIHLLQDDSIKNLGRLILVAPANLKGLESTELAFLKPFYENIDLQAAKSKIRKTEIYLADNDPYISLAEAKVWEKELNAKATMIHGGGHLNVASGCTSFPEILASLTGSNRNNLICR
jgi:predicted alpha/beta hydrolase family esterase